MNVPAEDEKQGKIPATEQVDFHRKMRRRSRKQEKLSALFVVGVLLFNYPFLHVVSVEGRLFGLPILYVYLFSTWLLLIGLAAWIIERRR